MTVAQQAHAFTVRFRTREGLEETGPLDLLWRLIESYQVDIFQVSLSRITDDFIAYMQQADLDLEQEADFAMMAAKLLFYKSKLLLPDPGYEEEYEEDSLPFELVDQLLEYKRFQQAADVLRDFESHANMVFSTEASWQKYETDSAFVDLDLVALLDSFREFLIKTEKQRPVEIESESFTLEEIIDEMREEIKNSSFVSFFSYGRKDATFSQEDHIGKELRRSLSLLGLQLGMR